MRNFFKLSDGLNTQPLLHQLVRNEHLWNEHRFRTTFPNTPHKDVDDIWLRFSDPSKCDTTSNVIGDDKPIWYPAAGILTEAKPIILALMGAVGAYELGRVIISRLPPNGQILQHRDRDGDYVQTPDIARYHIVLQGEVGSMYWCGEPEEKDEAGEVIKPSDVERVEMLTGQAWWFNAHKLHRVHNLSDADRIHMLVDVRTWDGVKW